MKYSDSHTEFIHHADDLKDLDPSFLLSQINPKLINKIKPNLLFLACSVLPSENSWQKLLWIIDQYSDEIAKNDWVLVNSKKDLQKPDIKIILHIEDLSPIGDNIEKIDQLYNLGIRSIGLTHNQANQFCGGSLTPDIGLSNLGKKTIKKILDRGIILDLAHISKKGFIEATKRFDIQPFISHTGIWSIFPNPRNVDDDILTTIKKKGGYIGVGLAGSFLGNKKATLKDYINQINYAIKICGNDKVGIGSDFGGITSFLPNRLEDIAKISNIQKDTCEQIANDNLRD
jgi:membrane dipeptidase